MLGYHFGVPWMSGGLLGVGLFFTLSGFLITSILVAAWERTGSFQLRRFWLQRARRLLPAVILVLAVVLVATALVDPEEFRDRTREALGALFYVSNWTTIADNVSYFEQFAGPGPFDHLWSLAVEEQFYLVWPLVLVLFIRVLHLSRRAVIRWTFGLAALSFALLAIVAAPGFDNTRAYEGTDTRAGGLLIGAAFALILRPWLPRSRQPATGRALADAAGLAALGVVCWLVVTTDAYSMSLYHGGLLVLSLASAVLVAAVANPGSRLGAALGVTPLRWVGERSYGIYLWHLPLVAFVPAGFRAEHPWRAGIGMLTLTLILASLSWWLVEDPIRRHGFIGAFRDRWSGWAPAGLRNAPSLVGGAAIVALVAVGALTITGTVPNGAATASESALLAPGSSGSITTESRAPRDGHGDGGEPAGGKGGPAGSGDGRPDGAGAGQPDNAQGGSTDGQPVGSTGRPLTSCRHVVHIGDSTSIGLMSSASLADRRDWIDRQYEKVGVNRVITDISGARSIVETYEDQPNAEEAVRARLDAGYHGCWVFAMGTNDTANQYVGGVVPLDDRIARLMDLIGDAPAMWLTVRTTLSSGPWNDAQMQKWNAALERACGKYPTMRVYDWRSEVKDGWYLSDGIHFDPKGYEERAQRIAGALAVAFPRGAAPASGCLVGSP